MKIAVIFAILMVSATAGMAQDRMTESLRKGVVEEESKHNLDAAIQNYKAAISQFDEARQVAATALFRVAECDRKLGRSYDAIAAYKRVAQEFADQRKLADDSRAILASTYHNVSAAGITATPEQTKLTRQEQQKNEQARKVYQHTLEEEVKIALSQLNVAQERFKGGVAGMPEVTRARMDLVRAQEKLDSFNAGLTQIPPMRKR